MVTGEGGCGRFGALSGVELERFFSLDDEGRRLIAARRRDCSRLGFALQVVTVRQLGMFLADPLAAANTALVQARSEIRLAQVRGGGLLASVDGIRFVVPVRSIHYAFHLPDLGGSHRPLRDPDSRGD